MTFKKGDQRLTKGYAAQASGHRVPAPMQQSRQDSRGRNVTARRAGHFELA